MLSPSRSLVRGGSILVAGALAVACGEGGASGPIATDELMDWLEAPTPFDLDPDESSATAVAGDSTLESGALDLPILDGRAVARVNREGQIVVDSLEVTVDDLVVSPEIFPPVGLALADIRATIERPATAPLDDLGDMVATVLEIDLLVEWKAVIGDERRTYPLRTMRLSDLPVAVEIDRRAGRLHARVSAMREGSFWSWADLVEFRDLTLDLALVAN